MGDAVNQAGRSKALFISVQLAIGHSLARAPCSVWCLQLRTGQNLKGIPGCKLLHDETAVKSRRSSSAPD